MSNPLVRKDLFDAIVALRADVEREVQANTYYVALIKLDEVLAAIKPLGVKRDLVDAIVELRRDVEKQLRANTYHEALIKLDELLTAIKPLGVIEAAGPAESPKAEPPRAEAKPDAPAAPEPQGEEVRTWSGVVKEPVRDSYWHDRENRPEGTAKAS